MISKEAWAKGSPKYETGQKVWAYADNTPCTIVSPDPTYPGYWLVIDTTGKRLSVAWDNLLSYCSCGNPLPPNQCYACETLGAFLR